MPDVQNWLNQYMDQQYQQQNTGMSPYQTTGGTYPQSVPMPFAFPNGFGQMLSPQLSEGFVLTGKKKWVVKAVGTNGAAEEYDTKEDALKAASRLSAKDDGEYLVLQVVSLVRPKKDVIVEDL